MLPCTNGEILQDALDCLVGLVTDERMPEDLALEITMTVDNLMERIADAGGRCHE